MYENLNQILAMQLGLGALREASSARRRRELKRRKAGRVSSRAVR